MLAIAAVLRHESHDDADSRGAPKDGPGKRGKMHPKKWEKKKRRWTSGPKARSQMSENERVAMGAGASSGIMGPGEW